MKKVFLITYDLKKPGQDYSSLYQQIKGLGEWIHPLESTWAVKVVGKSATDLYNNIRLNIDENDSLFVVEITDRDDKQGWMPKTFWDWLNAK